MLHGIALVTWCIIIAFTTLFKVTWEPMLVCNEHEETVLQSVSAAFNDESTADLKIAIDGKIIFVHKSLLKIR